MSASFDDEEIASLVEETTGNRRSSRKAAADNARSTPGSFRSCWMIALALVAALFIVAIFTDSVEIKINMGGAADIEDTVSDSKTDTTLKSTLNSTLKSSLTTLKSKAKAKAKSKSKAKSKTKAKSKAETKSSSASIEQPPLVHRPPVQEPGYKGNAATLSDTYLPRAKPIDETDKEALAQKYGTCWTLLDPKADQRPKYDFYSPYPCSIGPSLPLYSLWRETTG
jgi:hypothetical protein